MKETTEHLEQIFASEISRLHDIARNGGLSVDEVKKMEVLTRAWKTFHSTEVKEKEVISEETNLSTEELLALAREEKNTND